MRRPDYRRGNMKLWQGDAYDLLPQVNAHRVGLLLTDPPYGIAYEASRYQHAIHNGVMEGDDVPFDPAPLLRFTPSIIWGGNNFADRLPPGGWLCWDKRCGEKADRILSSPFELAWCSDRSKFKMLRLLHGGAVNADGKGQRVHPTQKPIRLMDWCLSFYPKVKRVLDPFMGSGTSGIVCIHRGMEYYGFELDAGNFDKACRRIDEAIDNKEANDATGNLFGDVPTKKCKAGKFLPRKTT